MKPRFSTHLFHRVWETLVEKCEEAVRKDVPSILNQNLESESVLTLFQYPSGKGPTVNAKILPANRKSKHKMILFFKFWGFLRDSQVCWYQQTCRGARTAIFKSSLSGVAKRHCGSE